MTSVEYGVAYKTAVFRNVFLQPFGCRAAQPQEEIDPDPPSLDASFLDAGIAGIASCDGSRMGRQTGHVTLRCFQDFKEHGCSGLQAGRLVK